MPITMTEMQKSALQEAGNIGSGHAAIALSQLMGRKIMIAIPEVAILQLPQLSQEMYGRGKILVQVSLAVLGQARGVMVFTLEENIAMLLCDILMGQANGKTKLLGELEQSALKEVGSILSASYLNAISEMTGLSLLVSTPSCNIGEAVLLDKIVAENDISLKNIKDVLCIKTEFIESSTRIEGYLIFIPLEDAVEKIISKLVL